MSQTETAIESFALTDWENARRRRHTTVPNDDATIMQSSLWMKNREEELDGEIGFELNAGFFINADGSVAFDRDQGTELFTRKLSDSLGEIVHHFPLFAGERENGMAAQCRQGTSKFGLENDDESDGEEDGETANDPAYDGEFQERRNQGECEEDNGQSGQNFRTPSAAEIEVTIIDYHRQQHDLEGAAPAEDDKVYDAIDHGALRSASATRKASTFSSTSCTRKTSAPFIRSKEVNAIVGERRWWIEPLCPEILPRNDLRDTPTTSGRLLTRKRGKFFSNERLCSSVFPNPIPGSNASVMGSIPNFRAQAYCCRKKSATSTTTS